MLILVTGARRGIGRELVSQLAARGDIVVAVTRDGALDLPDSPRIRREACELADDASIAALAKRLAGTALDAVINNAGVWGGDHQSVDDFDPVEAARTYRINALAPLAISLALLPNLRRGKGKKLLHVTSGLGSIADNSSGGDYAYRMSKAALNMMSRSLAVDLRRDGIASAVINPGWVSTDMGGRDAPTKVGDSVRGILRELDKLSLATSGSFLNWKGGHYAW